MSWSESRRDFCARFITLGILALPLAGCLHPVYGNLSGGNVADQMRQVAIEPVPDRFGHYLGDKLIFAFNGTGSHPMPKYRLYVTTNESVSTPLIDTVNGLATGATLVITAEYRLVRIDTDAELTKGKSTVFKSYDRTSQRFSNIRAARDAEIRTAESLADELRIRISSYFAEHPQS